MENTLTDELIPIKQILIEYSSRLQVANFFILFTKLFADTETVKINLKPNEISIVFDGDNVTLDLIEHFQLETRSLSLLKIGCNNVSFRLNTNNEDNFHFEYINLNNNHLPSEALKLKLNIESDKDFQIVCSNCTCPLTTIQNYRRILELPSENLDLSEWFCHKHHPTIDAPTNSDHNPIQSKEKFNFAKFNPRQTDFLFGQFFFLFNKTKLINVKAKNGFIYCRRCLQFIAEPVRDETIKIWDENIKIQSKMESVQLFEGSSLFKNFFFVIKKIIQDFDFMSSAGLPATNKILFETKCIDGTINFLLLQIMNKNLELFTLADIVDGKISVRHISGMKVFYRIENDETRPMVKFWENDVGCSNVQISKKMFDHAVNTLNEYSNFVPSDYRDMGGFTISYLHI